MANTKALVRRRKSVRNTRKITKTMEMVSTARLAKAQSAAVSARPYAQALREVIARVAAASADARHPLLQTHPEVKRAVLVVLTSDRGLCGGFNAAIVREALHLERSLAGRGVQVERLVQGRKGLAAYRFHGLALLRSFVGVSDKPSYARAEEVAATLATRFLAGGIDEAYVVYSTSVSMTSQRPHVARLLPLSGVDSEPGRTAAAPGGADYLFHPTPETILNAVLPLAVRMALFAAMLENAAGEHAARRLAMKNATDAADEMIRVLTRQYNRARQGRITQEIAEIVGGAQTL